MSARYKRETPAEWVTTRYHQTNPPLPIEKEERGYQREGVYVSLGRLRPTPFSSIDIPSLLVHITRKVNIRPAIWSSKNFNPRQKRLRRDVQKSVMGKTVPSFRFSRTQRHPKEGKPPDRSLGRRLSLVTWGHTQIKRKGNWSVGKSSKKWGEGNRRPTPGRSVVKNFNNKLSF